MTLSEGASPLSRRVVKCLQGGDEEVFARRVYLSAFPAFEFADSTNRTGQLLLPWDAGAHTGRGRAGPGRDARTCVVHPVTVAVLRP